MSEEYKKTLDDEIDWKVIDQLHAATLNFSNTSLELKKLFFVLIGIAVPTLVKLAGNKLDYSLFITLYILILTFWFLDSFTYYYQEKLREKMDKIFHQIKVRNEATIVVPGHSSLGITIDSLRTEKKRFYRSIFNASVIFYIVLFIINSLGITLHIIRAI